jgi:mannosyl-3-phosphoglycerate phosphatase
MTAPTRNRIVVTDLDGTLLDHDTYSFAGAQPALEALRAEGVPLVLVTSKSQAETDHIRRLIDVPGPDIPENGAWSRSYQWICGELARLSSATGVPIRGFHQMSPAEVAAATGLPAANAERAKQKRFSEAFLILDAARAGELTAAIEQAALRWTRGGRFHSGGDCRTRRGWGNGRLGADPPGYRMLFA